MCKLAENGYRHKETDRNLGSVCVCGGGGVLNLWNFDI